MHVSELATGKNLDCINSCTRIAISPQKVSFIFYIQTVIVTLQRLFECGGSFFIYYIFFFLWAIKSQKIWEKKIPLRSFHRSSYCSVPLASVLKALWSTQLLIQIRREK